MEESGNIAALALDAALPETLDLIVGVPNYARVRSDCLKRETNEDCSAV